MDTPFRWARQIASHDGGTRNGRVIFWLARINDRVISAMETRIGFFS
jgi:hypothetical protein